MIDDTARASRSAAAPPSESGQLTAQAPIDGEYGSAPVSDLLYATTATTIVILSHYLQERGQR